VNDLFQLHVLVVYSVQRLGYGLDGRGSIPGRGSDGIFLFTTASRPALGPTQLPFQWVPTALTPSIKRPVREADHSPPSSAEVENKCSYTSAPQYAFMAWCLVKHSPVLPLPVVRWSSGLLWVYDAFPPANMI
jgi:hypothetical protein